MPDAKPPGEHDRSRALPLAIAGMCFAIGMAVTFALWQGMRKDIDERLRDYFEYRVRDAESRIGERVRAYEGMLDGVAALMSSVDRVDRDRFRDYVASLDVAEDFPAARALGFALLVPAAERDRHVASVRAEGFPDYAIRPEGVRDPYTSVLFIEPWVPGNERVMGWDGLAEPVRRAAMERARDTGQSSLTGPIELIQDPKAQRGIARLVFAPVYRRGMPHRTVEERRAAIVGWVYQAVRMDVLMENVLGERAADLDVAIHDGVPPSAANLLYDDSPPPPEAVRPLDEVLERTFDVAGRSWSLVVRSTGRFEQRRGYVKDRLVAIGGATLSLLTALLVWALTSGHQRTRAALRRSRSLHAALIESIPDEVWFSDTNRRFALVNPSARRAFGLKDADGAEVDKVAASLEIYRGDGTPRPVDEAPPLRALRGEVVRDEEEAIRSPATGQLRYRLVSATPVRDAAGSVIGSVTIARDVTDRKRREQLNAARIRLQDLAHRATMDRFLTAALDEAEALTGSRIGFLHFVEDDQETLSLQAWSTNTTRNMCTAEGIEQHYPLSKAGVWADAVREGRPVVHDDYASLPGRKGMPPGHAPVIREAVVPVLRDGRVRVVLGVGNKEGPYGPGDVETLSQLADEAWNLAERIRAEEALRESEARFRALADDAPVGIHEWDAQGHAVYLNRASLRILGLTPALAKGVGWHAALHPADRRRVVADWEAAVAAGRDFTAEFRILRADRSARVVRAHSAPLRRDGDVRGFVGVLLDLTEQRALEQQLSVTSRMAAVGTLVAGVAHEINNPLAASLASESYAAEEVARLRDLLRSGEPLDRGALATHLDDLVDALRDARDGSQRISRIVKDLSVFGRQDSLRNRVHLREVVDRALRWLPGALATKAAIQLEDGQAPPVLGSEGQLGQVVVNLLTNAAKALPPDRKGTITIRLGPGRPGMARIEVSDDGVGIPADALDRIFDPFYTTREVGKGMGLGLPICHAIVTAHGGTITATSIPGEGSTFRVELPTAVVETSPTPPPAPAQARE